MAVPEDEPACLGRTAHAWVAPDELRAPPLAPSDRRYAAHVAQHDAPPLPCPPEQVVAPLEDLAPGTQLCRLRHVQRRPSSLASVRVRPCSPALAEAYQPEPGRPSTAIPLETLTIRPPPRARMAGATGAVLGGAPHLASPRADHVSRCTCVSSPNARICRGRVLRNQHLTSHHGAASRSFRTE